MGIIKFNKKNLSKEEIVEQKVNNCNVHLDNFMHDIFQLLDNEGYGEVLEENLSGIVIAIDFDNNEYTTELFITDEKIDEDKNK